LENPENHKTLSRKTSKNVERLVNLINDLDEISKLERGELVIYKQNFIVQELIRETFESLSIKSGTAKNKIQYQKGMRGPATVFADKEKNQTGNN